MLKVRTHIHRKTVMMVLKKGNKEETKSTETNEHT